MFPIRTGWGRKSKGRVRHNGRIFALTSLAAVLCDRPFLAGHCGILESFLHRLPAVSITLNVAPNFDPAAAAMLKKSLRNFKIVGDNVGLLGVWSRTGDKKECRKVVEELQNRGG
jgi:hypothetical protein